MIRGLAPAVAAATMAVSLPWAPSFAAPGDRIGSTVLVVDKVTAEYERDIRTLAVGDPVRHSELIAAGPAARTEIKLDDSTKLALGPGARLRLDKFVYNPDKAGNAILVDLLKGAFRFMTGVAAKPSYVVRTPTAAITVRGTIFDVFVRPSGETWLLLNEGGVQVCSVRGKCRVLDNPGRMIRVSEDGDVGNPACWTNLDDVPDFGFDEAFPFIAAPPSIDAKPEFTRAVLLDGSTCGSAPKIRKAENTPEPRTPKVTRDNDDAPVRVKRVVKAEPETYPVKPRRKVIRVVEVQDPPVIRPTWTVTFPVHIHHPDMPRPPYPDMPKPPYPNVPKPQTGSYPSSPINLGRINMKQMGSYGGSMGGGPKINLR